MTSRDFAYWLQGFFEISDPVTISAEQTDMIKRHLALVFFHEIDPSYSSNPGVQGMLNEIHGGSSSPVKGENMTCGTSGGPLMSCGTSGTGHSTVESDPKDYMYTDPWSHNKTRPEDTVYRC